MAKNNLTSKIIAGIISTKENDIEPESQNIKSKISEATYWFDNFKNTQIEVTETKSESPHKRTYHWFSDILH